MKCNNCGNIINSNEKFCSNCGMKKKNKIGAVSIISLVILVLCIIIPIIISIFCIFASYGLDPMSSQVYGWVIMISFFVGLIIIPYFGIIFIVSLICDLKGKYISVKNILVIIFLVLPLLFTSVYILDAYLQTTSESNKKTYTFKGVTATFSNDMTKYGWRPDGNNKESEVDFTDPDRKCSIIFGVSDYNSDLSLINNFKEKSDRFVFVDSENRLYKAYDTSKILDNVDINGKTWSLYEYKYELMNYKMYGLVINNDFYKIEIEDTDINGNSCIERANEFLNSVEYK